MDLFNYLQFSIDQDGVTWKIGTDGELLGSWCEPVDQGHLLDIGTGTGLLALMIAQRFGNLVVSAVEIDAQTCVVTRNNFDASPWSDRLSLIEGDVFEKVLLDQFDHIVCNPPYFDSWLISPKHQRFLARNGSGFDPAGFTRLASRLLTESGGMSIVRPIAGCDEYINEMAQAGFYLKRRCDVRHSTQKPVKRVLIEFSRVAQLPIVEPQLIMYENGIPSTRYRSMMLCYRDVGVKYGKQKSALPDR